MAMTLRRNMAYQIAAMIVGLALLSGASLWGIFGLHQDFSSAITGYHELQRAYEQGLRASLEGYEQLRQVYGISAHLAVARTLLNQERPNDHDVNAAMSEVHKADAEFNQAFPGGGKEESPRERLLGGARRGLDEADARIASIVAQRPADAAGILLEPINGVLGQVANLESEIRKDLAASQLAADAQRQALVEAMNGRQREADRKQRTTIVLMSVLVAIIIASGIAIGIVEYRSVTRPLASLGASARRIAEGDLSQRVRPDGHAEFGALASDFNRMANELDELYKDLEGKVAQKSKHLVRSERLASVGFLAAGVAHEINNPISIISGYAELSLEQLKRRPDEQAVGEAQKALAVIAEEAFRCKQIVEKLLSLARPGEEVRRAISLGEVAANVASIVGGIKDYRERKLTVDIADGQGLKVMANENEMKQVVLNLTLNALEAVENGSGRVEVSVSRQGRNVELCVSDNGRGMGPQVLERAFEPFFTVKRGSSPPGTGLGLSIAHAIVQNHGGEIAASSDGVGKGSRFTVRLPALEASEV